VVFKFPEAIPVQEEPAPRLPAPAPPPAGETTEPVRKSAGCGRALLVGLLLSGALVLAVGSGGLLALFWLDSRPTASTFPAQELVASKPPPAPPVVGADHEANPEKQPKQPLPVLGGADAPSIPLQTLNALKAATVFIQVEAGALGATGSGFVVKSEGE